jgi:hypothetical protein
MLSRLFYKGVLPAASLLLILACISRDNPWDPLHYDRIYGQKVLDSATVLINFGLARLPLDSLAIIQSKLSTIEVNNAKICNKDTLIIKPGNDDSLKFNKSADSANKNLKSPFFTFVKKRYLLFYDTLHVPDTFYLLQSLKMSVSLEQQRADTIIANANKNASPLVIFPSEQRESILARYDSILRVILTIDSRVTSLRAVTLTTNATTIKPYNKMVQKEDSLIKKYNDSMASLLESRQKVIPFDTDSLSIYLQKAVAGDTLILSDTTFEKMGLTIRFDHSGFDSLPIIVQGKDKTTLKLIDVVLDGNSYIIFNKINFTASSLQCVLVQNGCTGIVFNNCQFASNSRGMTISNSDVTLNNCRILNGLEGMLVTCSPNIARTVTLNNTLILSTGGNAISVAATNLLIQYATILRNGGEAIYLSQPALNFTIRNTIIANNGGSSPAPAIYFDGGYTGSYQFTMSKVNMYQNGGNQDTVNAPVEEPILHYDPMFINEYEISPSSVLDSLEKAGTVIGYRKK